MLAGFQIGFVFLSRMLTLILPLLTKFSVSPPLASLQKMEFLSFVHAAQSKMRKVSMAPVALTRASAVLTDVRATAAAAAAATATAVARVWVRARGAIGGVDVTGLTGSTAVCDGGIPRAAQAGGGRWPVRSADCGEVLAADANAGFHGVTGCRRSGNHAGSSDSVAGVAAAGLCGGRGGAVAAIGVKARADNVRGRDV